MITKFFLIVNSNGSVRAVKNRPGLDFNEVSVAVSLQLPSSLFQKPQLNASIIIPEESVTPTSIDAEVADNIKEAIEASTGLEVRLIIENPAS